MFSDEMRCVYQNNQLADVICQFRFPEILTIEANTPVDFQEAVRKLFPKYALKKEISAPRIVGTPNDLHLETAPATNNYQFSSIDGVWRINLTSKFVSLSCSNYTRWESFASRLDLLLSAFIQVYEPGLFERIGLRYINAISRRSLELESFPYRDLIQADYLGPLSNETISESSFHRSSVDFELKLGHGIIGKIHAGPGVLNRNGTQDPEPKFIFDQDLYIAGNLPVNIAATTLDAMHSKATRLFRNAITDTLHNAMEPQNP